MVPGYAILYLLIFWVFRGYFPIRPTKSDTFGGGSEPSGGMVPSRGSGGLPRPPDEKQRVNRCSEEMCVEKPGLF